MSYHKTSLLLLLALVGNLIAPSSATNNTTKELCHPDDKRALLQLKQFLNTSLDLDSWDPATDCCNVWFSVQCDSTTNRINSLILVGSDEDQKFNPFPSAIGNLPFLNTLRVNYLVKGPIPAFLSNLRHLTYLDLDSNLLSGPIPSFFGTSFSNLTELYLSYNLLTGTIPSSLGKAPLLSTLDVSYNRLRGPIPESFGSIKIGSPIVLLLPNNKLSGEIPRSFDKANLFFGLDFSRNNLEGDPSFLFSEDKTTITFLDLSHNSFSFDMTNLTITSKLGELVLTHNKIYGSLPEALAKLPDLTEFDVSYNQLCGHIPRGTLNKFDNTSYLHNKCLCGTPLPHCK